MWLHVAGLCWIAVALALLSLAQRRTDGKYKWTAFATPACMGVAGIYMATLMEYRPEAAAAVAARPNPMASMLRTVGVPVDTIGAAFTEALRRFGLASSAAA